MWIGNCSGQQVTYRASGGRHWAPSQLQSMRQAAFDNPATPAPTSAWCPDASIGRTRLDGPDYQVGRRERAQAAYEAANSILTRSREAFALKAWAMKIAKRRGLKKARAALARRVAVIMPTMLRDGTLFKA